MPVKMMGGTGVVEDAQHTITDWVALRNQVQHAELCAQASQKSYANAGCRDV